MKSPRKASIEDISKSIKIIGFIILAGIFGRTFLNSYYHWDSFVHQVTPYNGEPTNITVHVTPQELENNPCIAQTLETVDIEGHAYLEDCFSDYRIWLESVNINDYPVSIVTDSGVYYLRVMVIGGKEYTDYWLAYLSLIFLIIAFILFIKMQYQNNR